MTRTSSIPLRTASLICLPLLLFMVSCSVLPSPKQEVTVGPSRIRDYQRPVTVVVMPFLNLTGDQDLHRLVRKSFYNHISSKNYRDIELNDVDLILKTHSENHSRTWEDLPPSDLGDLFHADFIIFGKVLEYRKIFAGIYSQIALKVGIEMVEAKSGEGVWRKTLIKRSHDGGVPFDLFGIIPAALRSGLHMTHERTMDLIERVNRDMVSEMPDPPAPALLPSSIDIQVASFLDGVLALQSVKEFEEKGLKPRIETVNLNGRQWHRVLLGPYEEKEAVEIRDALLRETEFKPFFIHRYPESDEKRP